MELYVADALFATGSGAGIVPIAEVDGEPRRDRRATRSSPALADGYRARTRDPRYLRLGRASGWPR